MHQDATSYGGPGDFVLDGDPAFPPLKGHIPPIFGPYLLRPNGCMDQDVTWCEARPWPRRLCVRWRPRSPSPKGGRAPSNFRSLFIVAKRLDGSIIIIIIIRKFITRTCNQDGTWYGGGPWSRPHCARWGTSFPPPKRGQSLQFSAHFYCRQTAG